MENLESHGILEFHFPVLESWNLSVSNGKSWKMVLIVQNKLGRLFFVKKRLKMYPKSKIIFEIKFRSWKTLKSHEKGHGKSWNFESSKEYKPCMYDFPGFMSIFFCGHALVYIVMKVLIFKFFLLFCAISALK